MTRRRLSAVLLLAAGCAWAPGARAQPQPGLCAWLDGAGTATDAQQPDVAVRASATAAEIRFDAAPRATVRLPGGSALDTVATERRNLPRRVEPGVAYRDVAVAVEISAHLAVAAERLCATGRAGTLPPSATPNAAAEPSGTPPASGHAATKPGGDARTPASRGRGGAAPEPRRENQ
jgi:hypothetical protein